MSYPDTINLPFNGEIIKTRFTQLKPDAASDPGPGYWVLLQGDALLLQDGDLYRGELPPSLNDDGRALQFGEWDGAPVCLLSLGKTEAVPETLQPVPWTELPDQLATIYGVAKQILYWERQSSHCSRCGSGEMTRIAPTWGKRCGGCGHEHYPHIHPCVIVLIKRGDEFLLARKPEWAAGRYSLVAGFVDFGESLEECVAREVFEETGLKVTDVSYVGSQNWPFPSQLMAGFVARHESGEIRVDHDELEDAQWFTKERMPPALPPRRSIARWIIDNFALKDEG